VDILPGQAVSPVSQHAGFRETSAISPRTQHLFVQLGKPLDGIHPQGEVWRTAWPESLGEPGTFQDFDVKCKIKEFKVFL